VVARIGDALTAMSDMINALLDINQIEAGAVRTHVASFPIDDVLAKLCRELSYAAEAKKIVLRHVPCGLSVGSDPRLLAQMVRNLLSNALKYTKTGKILVGCRRRKGKLIVEVWDSGIGIANNEIEAIFDEYHQVGNEARERSLGLGLGLSIVRRLGQLLDHRVRVRSKLGRGSVFTIEVPISSSGQTPETSEIASSRDSGTSTTLAREGVILIVEDDPELRELLEVVLEQDGHIAFAAHDGPAALQAVQSGAINPNAILTDFNLPCGMNGLQLATQVQEKLGRKIPVIVITGDISLSTLSVLSAANCTVMNKPVKREDLQSAIQQALASAAENG
jgi:two-component system CheB/CheR fusion protein